MSETQSAGPSASRSVGLHARFDVQSQRDRFPALSGLFGGRSATFFDNPAGTQVPQSVIDAMTGYLVTSNSNVAGAFATSRRSDEIIQEAHQATADLLGCDWTEVVFGPNMTTLTFHLSRSLARELKPGDEVIVTRLDHDANVAPWLLMAGDIGARVRWADLKKETCELDLNQFQSLINERTRLVAVGYASNAIGTVNDVQRVVGWAREAGAYSFVDAVHYVPHGAIDVRSIGCDFLACSAYKFFGPHAGMLFGRRERLERLSAYKVRPSSNDLPWKWETGTQNHEAMAGVTAAIDYLSEIGRSSAQERRQRILDSYRQVDRYESFLTARLLQGLQVISGVSIYGVQDPERIRHRVCTFAIRKDGKSPFELAQYLGDQNIFSWHGNYYALEPSRGLGVEDLGGWLRIGLVHYNTTEEIDRFLNALEAA